MSPYNSEKGKISTRTNLMVEAAKSKLVVLRARQAKRRRVILRHLFPSSDDCLLQIAEDYHLNVDYLRLRQLLRILGPRHSLHSEPDELVYKKRTILPMIPRLKSSLFYRKLLFELERSGLANSLLEAAVTAKSDVLRSRLSGLLPKGSVQHVSISLESRVDRKSSIGGCSSLDHLKSTPAVDEISKKNSGNDQDIVFNTYTGSGTFLKGTQSANPHNDYCQHFVDTGERPQNFIRDTGLKNRFEEYPKLRELIRLKDDLIQTRATPPMYLRADLKTFDLSDLQSKFDVILIEPPLEEYHRVNGATFDEYWNWQQIERLEIEQIIAPRSFVWIWCGSGEGLDAARRCLRKWGFRRCEDICWIKTNTDHVGHAALEPGAVFQRTKEHCLMGIHGTVRRSTDGDFIHSNIDIDLIIQEAPKHGGYAAKDKPTEIFHIIEHFCLGRRRLHLFGRDSTLRPGWLTVGSELSASNFDPRLYTANFSREPSGLLLGSSDDIERLRPKSPPPRHGNDSSGVGVGSGSGTVTGGSISLPPATMGQQQQQRHIPRVATHMGSVVPVSLMNSGLVVHPSGAGHVQRRSLGMVGSLPGKTPGSGVGGNTVVSTAACSGLQPSLLGLPSSLGLESGHHHQQLYGNLSSFLSAQSGIGRHSSLLQSRGGVMSTNLVGQANVSSLAALQAAAIAAASAVVGGASQPSAPTTVPFFPSLAVAAGPPLGWPSVVQPNLSHAGNLAAGMAALAAALAASQQQQSSGSVIPYCSSSSASSLVPGTSVSQAFSLPGVSSHLLLPAGVAKSATRPNLLATLAAAAAAAAATGSGATWRLSSDVFHSNRAGGNSTAASLSRSQQQHSWR